MENTPTVLRGKATRAFVMTVVLIWAVPAHGRAAVPAESVGPAGQALDAYIQQLDSVIKELREVGTLLREEKYEEARELLRKIREQASGKLDQSRENQLVRSIPNPRSGGWEHWKHHELFKWFTRAEAPDLALEEYRKAEEAGVTVDLEHKLAKTECLIRTGQYAQAAAELKQLLASDVPSDWERIHTRRIEALEELTDGVPLDTETIRRLYVAPGRNWYMRDIFPVLVAWNAPDRNKNAQAAGEVLLALMERSGDRQGQKLTCLWVAENQAVSQESAGEALVKAGNLEYELKDYETARQFWRRADKEYRDTAAWAKAVFNIGLSYKDEGKYSEAIAEFERILTADVDDMEPGAHIMETYRNYRPRAQWEIGLCHLAASKHAEALDAFVTGREKYPFKSWCGNCQDAFEYRYAFYEGLCHEYLGQWHKAVCRYFDAATVELYSNATVHVRLVDLYERAGQLDDLVSILDSWDKPQIAKYGEKAHLSSSIMRKIRQL
ncbi:MAG TPA: tetratricopeptide repeat protein, partial [Candidatus Hydrogenedentes bacterium]|nr:tetratricopeptide repeat protein [Candidatus Hydrogenedentota bacterium]